MERLGEERREEKERQRGLRLIVFAEKNNNDIGDVAGQDWLA